MKKYEVVAERVSLVIGKGSIVYCDDRQADIAKAFLKELGETKKVEKAVDETEQEVKIEKKTKKK